MTAAGFPHSGIPGSRAVCASPGPIAACRALRRLPMPRHPPCAHDTLRPRGIPPGAEGLEHDGTCHLYQWNKIRKLLSSAMKMRKRSPLIPLGMQRKLLCANVFHDMEIRYLISSLRIAMRLSRCPGIPGAGCWDGNGSPGGASSGGLWCSGLGLSE